MFHRGLVLGPNQNNSPNLSPLAVNSSLVQQHKKTKNREEFTHQVVYILYISLLTLADIACKIFDIQIFINLI